MTKLRNPGARPRSGANKVGSNAGLRNYPFYQAVSIAFQTAGDLPTLNHNIPMLNLSRVDLA